MIKRSTELTIYPRLELIIKDHEWIIHLTLFWMYCSFHYRQCKWSYRYRSTVGILFLGFLFLFSDGSSYQSYTDSYLFVILATISILYLSLLGWCWLIKLYRFPMYNLIICHYVYCIVCSPCKVKFHLFLFLLNFLYFKVLLINFKKTFCLGCIEILL